MLDAILVSPVDNREILLNGLSRRELRDLHYIEEAKMAKMILSYAPFSEERRQMLNKGYNFVENLKLHYERTESESFGATPASVELVKKVIENRKKNSKRQQIVYEAGVGMGYAVKELAALSGVKFYGCDVSLLSFVREMIEKHKELHIHEKTLFDDLAAIDDNFIDVFYADNVMEHMIPDEISYVLKRLNKKMRKGGQLILLIPNSNLGPYDVSRYYLPKGHKAAGFHFMEMGYGECLRLLVSHGFKPKWIAKSEKGRYVVERDLFFIKNISRIIKEQAIGKIKNPIVRSELFTMDVYHCYILEK